MARGSKLVGFGTQFRGMIPEALRQFERFGMVFGTVCLKSQQINSMINYRGATIAYS